VAFPPPWTAGQGLERFKTADDRPSTVYKVTSSSPYELELGLDYGDDRPWNAVFEVERVEPHRIVRMFWSRAIPDDIVIRPAVADDSAALNDLEVRAPMRLGQTTLVYDRGDDFLGFARLMGDNICFVAERQGELLGLACGALHPVRIGGNEYSVMLLHHLRVPREHRKEGIFSALNSHVFGAFDGRSDGAYGYTALENAEGMRIGGPDTWSITVLRALLDCAQLAGPTVGRPASPDDVDLVIRTLNDGHGSEELYLPYTPDSFAARMARVPDLYNWDSLLIGDGAVVGVWPAGLGVTLDRGIGQTTTRRAVVLDHGFLPGREEEFETLLRSWCSRLLDLGHTELMVVVSESSPGYPVIARLAARMDPFSFRMAVPEPQGTKQRGLYVDAIYF
jgi:hypothetical protein